MAELPFIFCCGTHASPEIATFSCPGCKRAFCSTCRNLAMHVCMYDLCELCFHSVANIRCNTCEKIMCFECDSATHDTATHPSPNHVSHMDCELIQTESDAGTWVVIVANGNRKWDSPVNDAALIFDTLRRQYFLTDMTRYSILLEENATVDGIVNSLSRVLRCVGPRDSVILYFSGCGRRLNISLPPGGMIHESAFVDAWVGDLCMGSMITWRLVHEWASTIAIKIQSECEQASLNFDPGSVTLIADFIAGSDGPSSSNVVRKLDTISQRVPSDSWRDARPHLPTRGYCYFGTGELVDSSVEYPPTQGVPKHGALTYFLVRELCSKFDSPPPPDYTINFGDFVCAVSVRLAKAGLWKIGESLSRHSSSTGVLLGPSPRRRYFRKHAPVASVGVSLYLCEGYAHGVEEGDIYLVDGGVASVAIGVAAAGLKNLNFISPSLSLTRNINAALEKEETAGEAGVDAIFMCVESVSMSCSILSVRPDCLLPKNLHKSKYVKPPFSHASFVARSTPKHTITISFCENLNLSLAPLVEISSSQLLELLLSKNDYFEFLENETSVTISKFLSGCDEHFTAAAPAATSDGPGPQITACNSLIAIYFCPLSKSWMFFNIYSADLIFPPTPVADFTHAFQNFQKWTRSLFFFGFENISPSPPAPPFENIHTLGEMVNRRRSNSDRGVSSYSLPLDINVSSNSNETLTLDTAVPYLSTVIFSLSNTSAHQDVFVDCFAISWDGAINQMFSLDILPKMTHTVQRRVDVPPSNLSFLSVRSVCWNKVMLAGPQDLPIPPSSLLCITKNAADGLTQDGIDGVVMIDEYAPNSFSGVLTATIVSGSAFEGAVAIFVRSGGPHIFKFIIASDAATCVSSTVKHQGCFSGFGESPDGPSPFQGDLVSAVVESITSNSEESYWSTREVAFTVTPPTYNQPKIPLTSPLSTFGSVHSGEISKKEKPSVQVRLVAMGELTPRVAELPLHLDITELHRLIHLAFPDYRPFAIFSVTLVEGSKRLPVSEAKDLRNIPFGSTLQICFGSK